ncbi:MAG: hypothetical protein CMJ47_05450 [Planctomyces sp.]|nr:hypothetical protein [Planctomyces sp.]
MHKKHISFVRPVFFLSVLLFPNLLVGVQEKPDGRRVVFSPHATVVAEGEEDRLLSFGDIIDVAEEREGWRYAPELNGWVEATHLRTLDQAAAELEKRSENSPSAGVFELRGRIADAQGKLQQAIDFYQQGTKQPDVAAGVWNSLGLALQRDEQLQPALRAFSEAIRLSPDSPMGYENRAGLLALMGDHKASLSDSNRALAIDPHRAGAYSNRGVTWEALGEPKKALADFTRALEEDPAHFDARANRALLNVAEKNWWAAATDYEQLRKYAPSSPDLANDYAWLLATCPHETVRNGRKAVELAELAVRLTDHRVSDYEDTLAAAFAEAGDFEKAIEIQQRLVKSKPDETEFQERLELYQSEKPFRDSGE